MSATTALSVESAHFERSLPRRDVLLLLTATLLAYANISVFFYFYEYLRTLSIDPQCYGVLIGVFSAVALVVRPVISSVFHEANVRRYLFIGAALVAAALASYSLAEGFWAMLLVRALHGLGFVVLGTALMTITVHYIPPGKSGLSFGWISIIILLPNTFVPPMLPFLTKSLGSFTAVLGLFAGITVLVFPVVTALKKHQPHPERPVPVQRLTLHEVLIDLKDSRISIVLTAMLLLYCTYALVFFFLDAYGRSIGIRNTGLFISLALATEIGIRLLASPFFDRVPKHRLAAATLVGLGFSYFGLTTVTDGKSLLLLAVLVGLGWGVAMPVLNGLMFDCSAPRFRAFNVNIGMQMFQAGLFLGPCIGGPLVASFGFTTLYFLCLVLSMFSAALLLFLDRKQDGHVDGTT